MPDRSRDDAALARALVSWFRDHARELPWRHADRDPYHALVSEFMLQQTQVGRVVERFGAFVGRFPDAPALARADESEVLGMWSGLGYYRRARLLHACAKAIVDEHGGAVPRDPAALRALPGIGAYTSGAIASIVFGAREPAVDGNVIRVLLRLERDDADPGAPATARRARARAAELLGACDDPGALSEGLMELGATVCTPRNPSCGACPWRDRCGARAHGETDQIPRPKARAARSDLYCAALIVRDGRGRVLAEQRPGSGLWARMWQPPAIESARRAPTTDELASALGARGVGRLGAFTHITTHRRVHFEVHAGALDEPGADRRFATLDELGSWGLSSAHRRAFEMA